MPPKWRYIFEPPPRPRGLVSRTELQTPQCWHYNVVPSFALVFKGRSHLCRCRGGCIAWCICVLMPQSGHFVPNFAMGFEDSCQIVTAPNSAILNFARSKPAPRPPPVGLCHWGVPLLSPWCEIGGAVLRGKSAFQRRGRGRDVLERPYTVGGGGYPPPHRPSPPPPLLIHPWVAGVSRLGAQTTGTIHQSL